MSQQIATYREFWPVYLQAHAKPSTRAVHYAGSVLALGCLGLFLATLDWRWLIAMPLAGYGFAWFAHFFVEHNRPATFGHPFWSLYSDFRMLALAATGRLGPEIARTSRQASRPA